MISGSRNGYCPWLRYDYVEISTEGFVQVDPGFAGDFEPLNGDPLGLARERYDLVLVSQVSMEYFLVSVTCILTGVKLLHTTPNPEEVLERIRAFLKP
jgi:hypothetical protein